MTIKQLITIVSIFLFASSQAQIENEIKSYVDSSEIIINNGRKLILKKLMEKDYKKAGEVYSYLIHNEKKGAMSAFYYDERIYLNLLIQNWDEIQNLLVNYKVESKKPAYPNSYPIFEALYDEIIKAKERIKDDIQTSNLKGHEKDVIELLLYLVVNDGRRDETYNSLYTSIQQDIQKSPYKDFFNGFLPKPVSHVATAFFMGANGMYPTGKFADAFNSGAGFYMSWDLNIGKVFTSTFVNIGYLGLKEPFTDRIGSDSVEFEKNEEFTTGEVGFAMGYFLVRNKHFHVAPFISLAGFWCESNRYTDVEPDEDYDIRIKDGFMFGPSIHAEVKLVEFEGPGYYFYAPVTQTNYFSLKFEAGYNILSNEINDAFKGNYFYTRVALSWGIGRF